MKTEFTSEQREQPIIQIMEDNLRKCVHCGFCLPVCPTYSILGDERDSPRGRIYSIKNMLEKGGEPSRQTVKHVDRCLSCLACVTACPSGVDYQHYIDYARSYIDSSHRRPLIDKLFRWLISTVITNQRAFVVAITAARVFRPISKIFGKRINSLVNLVPRQITKKQISDHNISFMVEGEAEIRVALLPGCAQRTLRPSINEASIRLLNRMRATVIIPKNINCCGAINYHLGAESAALMKARSNIDVLINEIEGDGLDYIVSNSAGCGTHIKDYFTIFQNDPIYLEKSERISKIARDITEVLSTLKIPNPEIVAGPLIIYHDACSLLHGQKIKNGPRELLKKFGFQIVEIPGNHFCCGSAGTYNLIQVNLAEKLKFERVSKINSIIKNQPIQFLVTGNIGCITQMAREISIPTVHTVELLDWATGGPLPGS